MRTHRMEPAAADRLVLVSGPGPEHLVLILLLAIAGGGTAIGVLMARRGRREAWALAGLFGLALVAAAVSLGHLPTRLVLDRAGVQVAYWLCSGQRGWDGIETVDVRPSQFGAWISFAGRNGAAAPLLWPRWRGLFVADLPFEPSQIATRIEAWRRMPGG